MKIIKESGISQFQIINHIQRIIDEGWRIVEVNLNYNPSVLLPDFHQTTTWPLIITFLSDNDMLDLRIYSVKAGYICEYSRRLEAILKYLGVQFEPEDIFTGKNMDSQGIIHITWRKNEGGLVRL